MDGEKPRLEEPAELVHSEPPEERALKRRMLIVEDNPVNRELLVNVFKNEFIVDTADDGASALVRLRRYGTGISVVLLDLIMPGMDGFAVLEKMRDDPEMQAIPVIVVSGMDERTTSLKTIKCGAWDFVTKPVNPELLRLRVHSAISKAENQRLRAQNSLLSLQSGEVARYRAVLESEGTVMAEYDVNSGAFAFDRDLGQYIAGKFSGVSLWQALSESGAAEEGDIEKMRRLLAAVAEDAVRPWETMETPLLTPSGARHMFRLRIIKRDDDFRPGDRLILAFTDMGAVSEQ